MMSQCDYWYVGTNAATQGPNDPLPIDFKIAAMKTIYPSISGHLVKSRTWLTMASELYEKHPSTNLLIFTDESWVIKTIKDYNRVEGKAHGFYNFENIEHIPTPRVSSSTNLRDAVREGDREKFSEAAGIDAETKILGIPYFNLVSKYL
jgi:hypothetical protein